MEHTSSVSASVNDDGVSVVMSWPKLVGLGEIAFAGLLLFGLFTRLTSAAVLGVAAVGGLTFHEVMGTGGGAAYLAEIYASNPLAMLLVGAVALTLLISGSGPLAMDRWLWRRRVAATPTLAASGQRTIQVKPA